MRFASNIGNCCWRFGDAKTEETGEIREGSTSWLCRRVRIKGKRTIPNGNLSQLETNLILLCCRNALCPCAFTVKHYSEVEVLGWSRELSSWLCFSAWLVITV